MKQRDTVLFGLPLVSVAFMAVFAGVLYHQFSKFEKSFEEDAKSNIAEESRMAEYVLRPLLNDGKVEEAAAFCKEFGKAKVRLSLIDLKGKVIADSVANTENMSNHLNRSEVQAALAGKTGDSMRYSSSLDRWMMYHAVKINTRRGDYILRMALSTDSVSRAIDNAKVMMFLALILGCWMILPLFLYIFNKIRKPLLSLLKSTERIASGELDTRIDIPADGMVKEIALATSTMAEQLKTQLERANRDKDEKQAILNAMSEAVLLIDETGDSILCNHAGMKLFNMEPSGRVFNIGRCGIPELLGLIRQSFDASEAFEKELPLLRNGITSTLLVKGIPLSAGYDKQLLLTITDLTNLRQLESFRSDFIANVSHEIKTPLTCIIGAAETLEDDDLSAEHKHRMLTILSAQSKRLNSLVQDILSLASLERKQRDTTREFAPLDLDVMLKDAVNQCREKAESVGMKMNITNNDPIRIDGDCQLLEQAVVNIVNNAINYSNSPKLDISLVRRENNAVIEIRDYGIGIAPEHQARIFERFYRVHKERSRELGGTGLGLAIVKHIIQLHHGRAELESTPGNGCAFRLVLPAQE